jgi:hypothetical protein
VIAESSQSDYLFRGIGFRGTGQTGESDTGSSIDSELRFQIALKLTHVPSWITNCLRIAFSARAILFLSHFGLLSFRFRIWLGVRKELDGRFSGVTCGRKFTIQNDSRKSIPTAFFPSGIPHWISQKASHGSPGSAWFLFWPRNSAISLRPPAPFRGLWNHLDAWTKSISDPGMTSRGESDDNDLHIHDQESSECFS